jgi:hypothetical protein
MADLTVAPPKGENLLAIVPQVTESGRVNGRQLICGQGPGLETGDG